MRADYDHSPPNADSEPPAQSGTWRVLRGAYVFGAAAAFLFVVALALAVTIVLIKYARPLDAGVILIILLLALMCVVAGMGLVRSRREWTVVARGPRGPHDCPACGYDLRASPLRCPECGTEPSGGAVTVR